jgi:hypothetical protein
VNSFDRPASDRGNRNGNPGSPNRSFGDSIAFGKKPAPRDNQGASRNDRGARADVGRGKPASRGNGDNRSFAGAGNGAPRRPRSFA